MVKRIEKTLVYLSYRDLFGFEKNEQELIDILQKLPLHNTLIYLTELLFRDHSDSNIKQLFIDHLANKGLLTDDIYEKVKERAIVSQQPLLALYKYIFAYGDKENLYNSLKLNREEVYCELILLSSVMGDKLSEEDTPLEDIFVSNLYFNHSSDIWSALGRTKFMLLDIAVNPTNFNKENFLNIHQDFQEYWGYSLNEYFTVISVLVLHYLNDKENSLVINKKIHDGWLLIRDIIRKN